MAGSQLAELSTDSSSFDPDARLASRRSDPDAIESDDDVTESPTLDNAVLAPNAAITAYVGRMSDRSIQRLVGGNAFLRGRLYARRRAIDQLSASGQHASAQIVVRTAEDPYTTEVDLVDNDRLASRCNCPGWRGPSGHCKHVAALLVALRDRQRPPRAARDLASARDNEGLDGDFDAVESAGDSRGDAGGSDDGRGSHHGGLHGGLHGSRGIARAFGGGANGNTSNGGLPGPNAAAGALSSGKRRRSRRRRRAGGELDGATSLEVLSTRRSPAAGESRGGNVDAWIPEDVQAKPHQFEYRMAVRSASLAVTPVLAGTRSAVPINEALAGFNLVPAVHRGLLRALARHTNRAQTTTSELRGEDAAEVLAMLKGKRVLLEPASMELRFVDEPLRPKLELDLTNEQSLRVRVVFQADNSSRRFSLANGAWFEGTPGWYLDTTEGVARPLADAVTPAWLQRLYRSPALSYPLEEMPRVLTEILPRTAASLATELPDLSSVADIIDATPQLQLRADGDIVTAKARLRVVYADAELPIPLRGLPGPLAFLPGLGERNRPRIVRREVGAELVAVQRLLDLGFQYDESEDALVATGDQAVHFWTAGIASLPEEWQRFIPDDLADVTIRDHTVQPRMRVSSGVDWLSLDMSFDVDGVAVDEHELRMCLEHGRRLVKLPDGSYAPVEAAKVSEVLARMAEIVASAGTRKKLPLSQAGRVQDLLRLVGGSPGGTTKVASGVDELFGRLDNLEKIELLAKPRGLKAELRPYQKQGFSWLGFLHEIASGGILADDMGLGKTLQAIALFAWLKSKQKGQLHLVVAPTSVVPNWQREIERFAPGLRTVVWQGPDRHELKADLDSADIIITNYALLRRDEEFLLSKEFGYVVLDEAQHIKNPLSATARVAKKLNSARRLALTGTPIENRLSEIWSIFDFVSPGMLGSLQRFEEEYARPIERGDKSSAERLRNTIRPFVLRRTKSEVAKDLPEKIEQEIIAPLTDAQEALYRQMLKQVRDSILSEIDQQGLGKAQIHILAALTRLRQVACDPRLTKLPGEWTDEESGKLAALREILSEAVAGGHRVLVFSQFVEMLKIIRDMLERDGITYRYLDGSTVDRMAVVDAFNNDESVSTFLISLKAGGSGLNLTGADTVVHFDPWWNPAVEDQATDRAHRIGQKKVVNVYRLIARGTVEEKILQLSEKKRALVANVLSSEGTPLKGLTRADVDELFSE